MNKVGVIKDGRRCCGRVTEPKKVATARQSLCCMDTQSEMPKGLTVSCAKRCGVTPSLPTRDAVSQSVSLQREGGGKKGKKGKKGNRGKRGKPRHTDPGFSIHDSAPLIFWCWCFLLALKHRQPSASSFRVAAIIGCSDCSGPLLFPAHATLHSPLFGSRADSIPATPLSTAVPIMPYTSIQ